MQKYRIFLVEDDRAVREGLVDTLLVSGYEVIVARDGTEARSIINSEEYDLALLDVVLPGTDGFTLLRLIRADRPSLPVIMVTGKADEVDRVRGLKLGADDYVVKPFSLLEMLARIEAVLRRSPERPRFVNSARLNNGIIDFSKRKILFHDGSSAGLTTKEFDLLRHLITNAGRTITRDEIMVRIWKMNPRMIESRSLDTTMVRLREKLGTVNAHKIKTLRGQGYTWEDTE